MKKLILFILIPALLPFTGRPQGNFMDDIPDDIRNSKAYKRMEWFQQQRAFPYKTIPTVEYRTEIEREMQKIKNNPTRNNIELTWDPIGPTGIVPMPDQDYWGITTGRIRALAVDPIDPETVYIGAACGGIWKTTDGGENWLDVGHDLESLSFGAFAIDEQNPEIIYAGSGETSFFNGFIHFPGKGLFKSTDGGESWDTIIDGFGDMTYFSDLALSPHNSDVLLAALASGSCFTGEDLSNEGIWKSTDGGITWIKTLNLPHAYDVAFHPTNPDIVFAAFGGMIDSSGFYISDDIGETWSQSNSGLQSANTISRIHFDISQSSPQVIYSVIYQVGSGSFWTGTTRAFKSQDGGENWEQISSGVNLGGFLNVWRDQGFYDLCIAVDPVDPDHVFIGNVELHETTDGSAFSPVRPYGNNMLGSLVHDDYQKFAFAPSDPDYFYIACDGGIYMSTDAGQTAASINQGLETLQLYRLASHPSDPDIVLAGIQDNGPAITFDGGNLWQGVIMGDGMECFFDHTNPDIVYACIQNGFIYKSTDGGLTFPSFIKHIGGAWITPIFLHPTDHMTLYSANKSILRSTDGGSTWTTIAQNVSPTVISTMAQSKVDPDNMIFATGFGISPVGDSIFIVKVSNDGGYTWTDVTDNIPGEVRWISRVVTDPWDENTMYVLRTGFSEGNKVWKTTDLGQSWTNISGDLPDLPCSDIFIDPENTDHIYVANDIGVYLTTDGGTSWEYASYGMPFVPVMDFDYVKIGEVKYLRAGTHGRSIYQTNIVGVGIEEADISTQNSKLKINICPNPSGGISHFTFRISQYQYVILKIYDLQGREIATIIDEKLPAGEHTITWDADGLPAGVYLVSMATEKELVNRKVVIY